MLEPLAYSYGQLAQLPESTVVRPKQEITPYMAGIKVTQNQYNNQMFLKYTTRRVLVSQILLLHNTEDSAESIYL